MIVLVFEFDGVQWAATRDLFEQLPQALAGRSVVVDYRPVAPPPGVPAVPALGSLAGPRTPGRRACEQVLSGPGGTWPPAHGPLPPASGPVPALVCAGRRFHGPHALAACLATLPPG